MAKLVVGDSTELLPPSPKYPSWALFIEGKVEIIGDASIGVEALTARVIGCWADIRVFIPIPMSELIASVREIYDEWEATTC